MRNQRFRAYLKPTGSEYPVKEPLFSFKLQGPFLGSLNLLFHPSVGSTFPDSCMRGHVIAGGPVQSDKPHAQRNPAVNGLLLLSLNVYYLVTVAPHFHFPCVYVLSHFSHVRLLATLWTVVCQTPQSMGFSRQEYWSAISFSRASSQPRNRTHVSCIAGEFFTS